MVDREYSPFGRKAARREIAPPGIILKIIREKGKGGVFGFLMVSRRAVSRPDLVFTIGSSWRIFPASIQNFSVREGSSLPHSEINLGERLFPTSLKNQSWGKEDPRSNLGMI